MDSSIKEQLIPGAVVVLSTPQGDFTVASGTTELGVQNLPDANTHFRIASNTKTMTSAVVLQLAQEGKLALSDPVSKYVSGVPDGDNITVEELLKMRTGLYNYTNSQQMATSLDNDPTREWKPQELLDIAFAQPANFAPDAEFEYSNTNYALLGMIIEKVDGKPLATAFQDRLFGPLGMTNTELPARPGHTPFPTPLRTDTSTAARPLPSTENRITPPSRLRRPRTVPGSPPITRTSTTPSPSGPVTPFPPQPTWSPG